MIRVIRKNLRNFAAIIVLATIGLLVSVYILSNQGFPIPFADEKPVEMHATLSSAQSVTPGQGQTVQVAGVEIGKIADVELRDGRADVKLDIERRYVDEGLIRTDAQALLRPRTSLKDMYIQVLPGSRSEPAAREGFTLPVQSTLKDVDLDEILSALDEDVREYLALLLRGTGTGLRDRGDELAEVLRRYGPTVRDLSRVNRSVSAERRELRRLVGSLARLNGALARHPERLSQLVSASSATFQALASEEQGLRDTVTELPPTLRQAATTLDDLQPFARELGPASRALTPALRELDGANREVRPFARKALAPVRDEIRPFARAARPLVRDLAPAAGGLATAFPELRRSGEVLNHFFNMLGFNRDGREGPAKATRDEGYLFWVAWLQHQAANLINVDDANGPLRPIFLTGTCGTLTTLVNDMPALEFAAGLSPILATLCGNPSTRSIDGKRAIRATRSERQALRAQGR